MSGIGIMAVAFLSVAELPHLPPPQNAKIISVPLQSHVSVSGQNDGIYSGTNLRFPYQAKGWNYCELSRTYEETENPLTGVSIRTPDVLTVSCFQDGQDEAVWTETQEVLSSDKPHIMSYFFGRDHEILVQLSR